MEVSERKRSWLVVWKLSNTSQVDRSGRVEADAAQRSECTVFVSQWAASGEKQDEEIHVQFWELSLQGG